MNYSKPFLILCYGLYARSASVPTLKYESLAVRYIVLDKQGKNSPQNLNLL
jgi:hypothetical protein